MLTVKSPDEALSIIKNTFAACLEPERVSLAGASGRVLSEAVVAGEYVPDFDRSTVDGYAVAAADTFGCSEAIPAVLALGREVNMGEGGGEAVAPGAARYVPTGGAVPAGADAVVMIEYAEDYGDGTVGILRPVAPGENMIYRGDDVSPGKTVLPAGHKLAAHDIGALAAMGVTEVTVCRKPRVGIISTGDELVEAFEMPGEGQIRNVNSPMLASLMEELGAESVCCGIVRDEKEQLRLALEKALAECDAVLISGGSSVGTKDATCAVIESMGEVLFHGIAMKPGKPSILGNAGGKMVFGLPGHPVAAYFVSRIFVRAALAAICGRELREYTLPAILTESVSANHGRAQYNAVRLYPEDGCWMARPIRSKSGLISSLAASDGYFCIPRDREGFAQGETVEVTLFSID